MEMIFFEPTSFLVADTQLYKSLCPSVRPSVGPSVREHKSKSVKTRISAPAHLSATGGRVSSLVALLLLPNRPRLDCRVSGLVFKKPTKFLRRVSENFTNFCSKKIVFKNGVRLIGNDLLRLDPKSWKTLFSSKNKKILRRGL